MKDRYSSGPCLSERQCQSAKLGGILLLVGKCLMAFGCVALWALAGGCESTTDRVGEINKLLAKAYTQDRKIELRIPGAQYSKLVSDSVHAGDGRDASSLLEARILLRREYGAHESDPSWLRSHAMVLLLMGDYKGALKKIDNALLVKPHDPALLCDRATINYAGSRGNSSSFNLGESIDELSEALELDSRNPIILFNRAILYEKAYLPDLAVADWARYLEIENEGGWSEEARTRQKRLQLLIDAHNADQTEPLLGPTAFLRRIRANGADPFILNRIEVYFDLAIREWLPKAYGTDRPGIGSRDAKDAMAALGKVLAEEHSDWFIRSLIASSKPSPTFARATAHLAQSVQFSAKGDPVTALRMAEKASREFLEAGSSPGYLRAEVEVVYSLRSAQRGKACLLRSSRIVRELEKSNFQWMKIQLRLDRCACFLMSGSFRQAKDLAGAALGDAKFRDFPVLGLRASGLAASVDSDEGDLINAWDEDEEGLREYWVSKAAPARRAQQFLDDLSYLAESSNESRLAYAFARESAEMISRSGDVILEAAARQHVFQLAVHNHDLSSARRELTRSLELLSGRSGKGMEAYQVWTESHLAEIDAGNGEIEIARKRLTKVSAFVGAIESFDVRRAFFKAQAVLSEKIGDIPAAESVLFAALEDLDRNLAGLADAQARSVWVEENSDLYRSLARLLLQSGDATKALAVFEWYRANLSGWSFKKKQSLTDFLSHDFGLRVKAGLHGRQVLAYAVFPKYLAVWVASESGVRVRLREIDQSTLLERVAHFSELCADPKSDLTQLRAVGRELFELLLGDVSLQEGRVVIFEPDSLLGDVPFAALVGRDDHFLGEAHAIQISPSLLHLLGASPQPPLTAKDRGLLVGSVASIADEGNEETPATDAIREVNQISKFFPNASVLKGADATAANVESLLREATFVHLAGHAVSEGGIQGAVLFDSSNPKLHKSVIWNPSRNGKRLLRRCRMAVFSACSTAQSDRGRKEQSVLLMRSFALAGVSTVVGSSWDVDSRSTSLLMVQFYRLLLEGNSVPESLRSASGTLRVDHETEHPYYWASFSVFASD